MRWRGRPVLAAGVQVLLLLVPLAASGLAVLAVDRTAPAQPSHRWPWIVLALVAAVVTGVAVERAVRRLVPLAFLLRMDMLFPERAPSRYRVAREAVSRAQRDLPSTAAGTAEHVMRLIGSLGAHDKRTRGHSERVRVYTDLLADELHLPAADRDRLRWASLLHDLGKLHTPVEVLNKPGRLTRDQFDVVKLHPGVGAELAAPLLPWLGEWGLGIVEHHEKYDGTGYPAGLAGERISRAGRLIGLVDAFETMTATRPYKQAMASGAARAELARCAGQHFDPHYVRSFLAVSLPRLLWAMGPVSFALQVPFLKVLATAGRDPKVAAPTAAGVATVAVATALALTGGSGSGVTAPSSAPAGSIVAAAPPRTAGPAEPAALTPARTGGVVALPAAPPADPALPVPDAEPAPPLTVDPAPVDPAPVNPAPVNPAPVNPAPVNPAPVNPAPVNPAPDPVTPPDPAPAPDPTATADPQPTPAPAPGPSAEPTPAAADPAPIPTPPALTPSPGPSPDPTTGPSPDASPVTTPSPQASPELSPTPAPGPSVEPSSLATPSPVPTPSSPRQNPTPTPSSPRQNPTPNPPGLGGSPPPGQAG